MTITVYSTGTLPLEINGATENMLRVLGDALQNPKTSRYLQIETDDGQTWIVPRHITRIEVRR